MKVSGIGDGAGMILLCIGQAGLQAGQQCLDKMDAHHHHTLVFIDTEQKTIDALPPPTARSRTRHQVISCGALGRGNNWVYIYMLLSLRLLGSFHAAAISWKRSFDWLTKFLPRKASCSFIASLEVNLATHSLTK